jgi:hypothetical protein
MSVNDDKQEIVQLRRLNEELTSSLERCRLLLRDCKSKLAANSNDIPPEAKDASRRERDGKPPFKPR